MPTYLQWLTLGVLVVLSILGAYLYWRFGSARRATKPGSQSGADQAQASDTAAKAELAPTSQDGPPAKSPDLPAPPSAQSVTQEPTPVSAQVDKQEEAAAVVVEVPEAPASRWTRLKERLARSGNPLGRSILTLLSKDRLSESDWDEIEETLLLADVGAGPTGEIMAALLAASRVQSAADGSAARQLLRSLLIAQVDPDLDRSLNTTGTDGAPGVVLVVGVNGTGKTTTVGKLARVLVAEDKKVVLGAADTFRAAAADQLQTWGTRVGVPTVRSHKDGADPAAVAFDAVKHGKATGADVVLVDTAGRLHTKTGLMDELGKVARVVGGQAPITETLLVLDATTGQNGMNQARVFGEVVDLTGIVLTKLDGTAKGGIVIAVQRELGVPVKLVGLGEGPDDLAPFDPAGFVDGLLG